MTPLTPAERANLDRLGPLTLTGRVRTTCLRVIVGMRMLAYYLEHRKDGTR